MGKLHTPMYTSVKAIPHQQRSSILLYSGNSSTIKKHRPSYSERPRKYFNTNSRSLKTATLLSLTLSEYSQSEFHAIITLYIVSIGNG